MTAVPASASDASPHAQPAVHPATPSRPALKDGSAFAGVLERLSQSPAVAHTAAQTSPQSQTPGESRRREPLDQHSGLAAAPIQTSLPSLFIAPIAEAQGQRGNAGAHAQDAPNAQATATGGASASPPAQPFDGAVLARLVGVRSFVLPSRLDPASPASGRDAPTGGGGPAPPSWASRRARRALARGTGRPRVPRPNPFAPANSRGPPRRNPAAPIARRRVRARLPPWKKGDCPAERRRSGGRSRERGRRRRRREAKPAPCRRSAQAPPVPPTPPPRRPDRPTRTGRRDDRSGSTSGDPAASPWPSAALSDPSGFPAALAERRGCADGFRRRSPAASGAAPAVAAQAKPPVREIDLDLSPSGTRGRDDDHAPCGRPAQRRHPRREPRTAGAIEGAREAIAERLAAIGQPLGSLVIQQTGSTHGTGNAAEGRGDDRRHEAESQDGGDRRGGARRGSDRF